MMDGGQPVMKQEKVNLVEENELVPEPFMSKPEEEFTPEERKRFNEYKLKEKEILERKEKIRSQALTKYNNCTMEIENLKMDLETKIQKIIKKKLYYDYRIYEQECYILSLVRTVNLRKNFAIDLQSRLKQKIKHQT